jgi:hypothetical protein
MNRNRIRQTRLRGRNAAAVEGPQKLMKFNQFDGGLASHPDRCHL